jgi:hypothetical protein
MRAGCAAKTNQSVRGRPGKSPLDYQTEQLIDDTVLHGDMVLDDPVERPFVDHVYRFVAPCSPLCCVKRSKAILRAHAGWSCMGRPGASCGRTASPLWRLALIQYHEGL